MLTVPLKKRMCHRKLKMKSFGNHEEYLARIAKSLYYVQLPVMNCTSLPVTELAAEIFSQTNRFSLNRLDIEKAAHYTRNGCVSPCLLVLALLYLERLKASNPKYLTKVSPNELFLISLLVGSKFLEDDGEEDELRNTDWVDFTGLSLEEINKAEREFLDAINWKVYIGEEEFWHRLNLLESKVGLRQGIQRGWFTYTELNVLLQLIDFTYIVQCLWNVTSACMLSYTASILALVGSTLLVGQIPGMELRSKVPVANFNNWIPSSFYTLPERPIIQSDRIQDCNVSSLELRNETKVSEPEFLNFSQPAFNSGRNSNFYDCVSFYFLNKIYLQLSPSSFLEFSRKLTESTMDSGFASERRLNIWILSDYVRSFLMKESIPGGLYSIASF